MPFKGKLGEVQSLGHAARYGDQNRKGKREIPVKCRKEPTPPMGGKMGMMYLIIKNRSFFLPKYTEIGARIRARLEKRFGNKGKEGAKIKGKREDR